MALAVQLLQCIGQRSNQNCQNRTEENEKRGKQILNKNKSKNPSRSKEEERSKNEHGNNKNLKGKKRTKNDL
jgi:hypothetical protein